MSRSERQAPIILGNAPSAGSTLLAHLLGRIPGIFHRGELNALDKPAWLAADPDEYQAGVTQWLRKGYPGRLGGEGVIAFSHLDEYGLEAANIPYLAREAETYWSFVDGLLARLAASNGCRRWLEKTPSNIFAVREQKQCSSEAQFIHIVREPGASLKSLFRRGFGVEYGTARWYLSNLIVYSLLDDPRHLILRYEDLVAQPKVTLRTVAHFLGEEWDIDLAGDSEYDGRELPTWNKSPSQGVRGGELPRTIPLSQPHASALRRIRPTRKFMDEYRMVPAVDGFELARSFGYDPVVSNQGFSSARGDVTDRLRYSAYMLRNRHRPRARLYRFVS
jgi:hypothetical protein